MTPLQIDMLLHYHCRAFEYHQVTVNTTRMSQAESLVRQGLLSFESSRETKFQITGKGKAHIKQLLELRVPEMVFVGHDGKVIEVEKEYIDMAREICEQEDI